MNHYALFIKLMDRKLPNELLSLLEQWFSISVTCVRWGACYSHFFQPAGWCETRRGLVTYSLRYIHRQFGCQSEINRCWLLSVLFLCQYFLYADDILLIAPSVSALQTLLHVCEEKLRLLDMQLNIQKSVCIHFGARFRVPCKSLLVLEVLLTGTVVAGI